MSTTKMVLIDMTSEQVVAANEQAMTVCNSRVPKEPKRKSVMVKAIKPKKWKPSLEHWVFREGITNPMHHQMFV